MEVAHGLDGWSLLTYEWFADGTGRFRYGHTSGKVVDTVRLQFAHLPRQETRSRR